MSTLKRILSWLLATGSRLGGLATLLAVLLSPLQLQAVTYGAGMNHAEWRLELSPFECRMWQPIPTYGEAVFQYRAGEHQRFYLKPTRRTMREGKASLVAVAPAWDSGRRNIDLGLVPVSGSNTPVKLRSKLATRLLAELYEGMAPVFTRKAWYSDDDSVRVGLSSVNFRAAYRQYRGCLAHLLPVNFDQIARSRLRFPTARWELTRESIARLDTLVEYVKADTSVTGFFVDGHTDDVGRRLYNLDLSKKRSETVTKYLVAKGIDESLITTRYHGERYPIVANRDSKSRYKNRRVTIRLDRDQI